MTSLIKNQPIGMIGFGRFGKVFAEWLAKDFEIKVYDVLPIVSTHPNIILSTLAEVLNLNTIFLAVPIRAFEQTVKLIAPQLISKTTVIDVCSVKCFPVAMMEKFLPTSVGIIATHPLFGPDSIHQDQPLKIVMNATRDVHQCFTLWENYFTKRNALVVKMTPDEHDRDTARSQSLTHFIGRCLQAIHAESTPIDTMGFKQLLNVMTQTCHDSRELFIDLIQFNPYSLDFLNSFVSATAAQLNSLTPKAL